MRSKLINLLCCPFCGCKMEMEIIGRDWYRIKPIVWHDDECPIDGSIMDFSQSEPAEEAARLWNMRAT